jgi:integration host factor subunit beta
MTKSELIERMSAKHTELPISDIEKGAKIILERMTQQLVKKERIEVRGFGTFTTHYRKPREGRNPKTGEKVTLDGKHVPHFKPGMKLRERVNKAAAGG